MCLSSIIIMTSLSQGLNIALTQLTRSMGPIVNGVLFSASVEWGMSYLTLVVLAVVYLIVVYYCKRIPESAEHDREEQMVMEMQTRGRTLTREACIQEHRSHSRPVPLPLETPGIVQVPITPRRDRDDDDSRSRSRGRGRSKSRTTLRERSRSRDAGVSDASVALTLDTPSPAPDDEAVRLSLSALDSKNSVTNESTVVQENESTVVQANEHAHEPSDTMTPLQTDKPLEPQV